jgi:hypothetical protein
MLVHGGPVADRTEGAGARRRDLGHEDLDPLLERLAPAVDDHEQGRMREGSRDRSSTRKRA